MLEALKHTEWTFGLFFFWFAFLNVPSVTFEQIVIILIGSQLPDYLEILLVNLKIPRPVARKATHDYLFILGLWILFPYSAFPEINLLVNALATHYLIDLFSGLEPIYLAGFIFGERTAAIYVTAAHRVSIGRRIEVWGSNYLITDVERPTPELAWFWIMQLSGTIFCGLGIVAFLL
ncbi:MAG: hypothetical protein ACFFE8_11250 [Candidatus Heimdallarchaeota archaeon]